MVSTRRSGSLSNNNSAAKRSSSSEDKPHSSAASPPSPPSSASVSGDMQIISSPCFGVMNCFGFSNGDKDHSEARTSKSISSIPSSISGCDMRTIGSEFGSNVSEISTESPARITFTSFSQRHKYLREFSISELKTATKNFNRSEMIGEGGFGGVYRGKIQSTDDLDKTIDIAVKQLSRRGLQGHKEWVTEVNVLGVVEHPNLVKLIGYCAEDDERGIQRLLVYEYLSNGSVQDHLSRHFHTPLPWNVRLKIAQGAAQGLAYLHEGMDFQIIFRDFKSSNILLDDQWIAKLSDFGLARLGPSDGFSHVTTAVVGTIGYAAPEYILTGRLTSKSDVWSYGVFLYELITGRRPYDRNRPKNEQKLLEWVRPHLSDPRKFRLIIDSRLEGKYSFKSVQKLASIANQCLIRNAKNRPKMSQVVEMINVIVDRTENTRSPRTPTSKLSAADNSGRSSRRERLKRTLVDPILGESGRLALQSWKSKIVSTN